MRRPKVRTIAAAALLAAGVAACSSSGSGTSAATSASTVYVAMVPASDVLMTPQTLPQLGVSVSLPMIPGTTTLIRTSNNCRDQKPPCTFGRQSSETWISTQVYPGAQNDYYCRLSGGTPPTGSNCDNDPGVTTYEMGVYQVPKILQNLTVEQIATLIMHCRDMLRTEVGGVRAMMCNAYESPVLEYLALKGTRLYEFDVPRAGPFGGKVISSVVLATKS